MMNTLVMPNVETMIAREMNEAPRGPAKVIMASEASRVEAVISPNGRALTYTILENTYTKTTRETPEMMARGIFREGFFTSPPTKFRFCQPP